MSVPYTLPCLLTSALVVTPCTKDSTLLANEPATTQYSQLTTSLHSTDAGFTEESVHTAFPKRIEMSKVNPTDDQSALIMTSSDNTPHGVIIIDDRIASENNNLTNNPISGRFTQTCTFNTRRNSIDVMLFYKYTLKKIRVGKFTRYVFNTVIPTDAGNRIEPTGMHNGPFEQVPGSSAIIDYGDGKFTAHASAKETRTVAYSGDKRVALSESADLSVFTVGSELSAGVTISDSRHVFNTYHLTADMQLSLHHQPVSGTVGHRFIPKVSVAGNVQVIQHGLIRNSF